MPYLPARCDTVMVPSGPAGDHLFVITTDSCPAAKHLLVSVTSVKPGRHADTTCVLEAGDHPFVEHQSYVLYRNADIQSANRLGNMVDSWYYRRGAPATPELTDRILAGFEVSLFTPKFIVDYLATIIAD